MKNSLILLTILSVFSYLGVMSTFNGEYAYCSSNGAYVKTYIANDSTVVIEERTSWFNPFPMVSTWSGRVDSTGAFQTDVCRIVNETRYVFFHWDDHTDVYKK